MRKLLPCPIQNCGGEGKICIEGSGVCGGIIVECSVCGCKTGRYDTEKLAIESWNFRKELNNFNELKERFFKETCEGAINNQGEPDIDYVTWLENLVTQLNNQKSALTQSPRQEFKSNDPLCSSCRRQKRCQIKENIDGHLNFCKSWI